MLRHLFIFIILLMLFLSACTPTAETPETPINTPPTSEENPQNPYPDPVSEMPDSSHPEAYPAPIEIASIDPYPSAEEIPSDIVPFSFQKPLSDGDTKITGTGPAGVPIEIVDVTFMRQVLVRGTIEKDNTFSFDLSEPLEKGHRLGIVLSDLAGTQWTEEQFANKFYNGSQAMNVPTVGFFFDTAMVK